MGTVMADTKAVTFHDPIAQFTKAGFSNKNITKIDFNISKKD